MSWIGRHLFAVAVVLFAVAATGAVFVFARPVYRPSSPDTVVDMTGRRHYTVAQVRQAFAAHGLRLDRETRDGTATHGLVVLSLPLRNGLAPSFTVTLFGTESTVSFGPTLDQASYESRFGNVSVFDGDPHRSRALMSRIEAAVAELKR